jgi:hypothetical protein
VTEIGPPIRKLPEIHTRGGWSGSGVRELSPVPSGRFRTAEGGITRSRPASSRTGRLLAFQTVPGGLAERSTDMQEPLCAALVRATRSPGPRSAGRRTAPPRGRGARPARCGPVGFAKRVNEEIASWSSDSTACGPHRLPSPTARLYIACRRAGMKPSSRGVRATLGRSSRPPSSRFGQKGEEPAAPMKSSALSIRPALRRRINGTSRPGSLLRSDHKAVVQIQ